MRLDNYPHGGGAGGVVESMTTCDDPNHTRRTDGVFGVDAAAEPSRCGLCGYTAPPPSGGLSTYGGYGVEIIGARVSPGYPLETSNLTRCDLRGVREGDLRRCIIIDCALPGWLLPGAEGITTVDRSRLHDNRFGNYIEGFPS